MPQGVTGAIVFVTGANGGLGRGFVAQFLERGAAKVYATARTPRDWDDSRVVPLALDVTDPASVAAAADAAPDVSIVINNAGAGRPAPLITGDLDTIRAIFDTNFYGAVAVARAFAPALTSSANGSLVNVLSVLAWSHYAGAYSASKAALWSATSAMRLELADAAVFVMGLVLSYTDTPMTTGLTVPKNTPADVVRQTLDGITNRDCEILADEHSITVKAKLSGPIDAMYPELG